MRPIVLRLLQREPVTFHEWQELYISTLVVCLWDTNGKEELIGALKSVIMDFMKEVEERVLSHHDDQALLKAYTAEWRKILTQCGYLERAFIFLESSLPGNTVSVEKAAQTNESIVRKLMFDSWNESIFFNIMERLQASAMKSVNAERNGEAFDSQLIIALRESYFILCPNREDTLQTYKQYFERGFGSQNTEPPN
jgi:cullin-5